MNNDKTTFGISSDSSIVLEQLPKMYPQPLKEFLNKDSKTFVVIAVNKIENSVILEDKDAQVNSYLVVDLESFENNYRPADPAYNYPL